MKKAEAISILATSVRPREAKDRARYDEAVKMAIEALKCSETPKSSERTSETAQADHTADFGKKVCVDTISRQAALKKLAVYIHLIDKTMGKGLLTDDDCMEAAKSVLGEDELPTVQPEIIRCKNCKYRYLDGMIWNCPFGLSGGENFFCGYGTEPYKGE